MLLKQHYIYKSNNHLQVALVEFRKMLCEVYFIDSFDKMSKNKYIKTSNKNVVNLYHISWRVIQQMKINHYGIKITLMLKLSKQVQIAKQV